MSDVREPFQTQKDDADPGEDWEAELTDYERAALAAAEKKFVPRPEEDHWLSRNLPLVDRRQIRGTWFSLYENNQPEATADTEPAWRDIPLILYSEKNRFAYLCRMINQYWSRELPDLLEYLEAAEAALTTSQRLSPEQEWEGQSFGLIVAPDHYQAGYHSGQNGPIFATKDFLLEILLFFVENLRDHGESIPSDGQLERLRGRLVREQENSRRHREAVERKKEQGRDREFPAC